MAYMVLDINWGSNPHQPPQYASESVYLRTAYRLQGVGYRQFYSELTWNARWLRVVEGDASALSSAVVVMFTLKSRS